MIYKMTLADKIKGLDDNNKTNEAQYNVDKEAAKISALSFFEKYICLVRKVWIFDW